MEAQVSCENEKQWLEVDRLQDVCRRIRAETDKRGVRFYEATFMCDRITGGTTKLETFIKDNLLRARFLRDSVLQIYSHITKIIARHDESDEDEALYGFMRRASFVQFCERNPQVMVIIRLRCTYNGGWTWLGMYYATLFGLLFVARRRSFLINFGHTGKKDCSGCAQQTLLGRDLSRETIS